MNDLYLCLEVVSRSRQPSRYIRRWISQKPLEIGAWFQRTTNRKCHMGYRIVTWPMTSHYTRRCCEAVRSAIIATAWLLVYAYFMKSTEFLSECSWVKCYISQISKPNELIYFNTVLYDSVCLKGPHGQLIRFLASECDDFEDYDVTWTTSE